MSLHKRRLPDIRRRWCPTIQAGRELMARQFIYHMQGLSGKPEDPGGHPPLLLSRCKDRGTRRQWLRQIHAAAYHGGHRHRVRGRAWAAEGARVGYLEQEPQLDAGKSVRENVMEGVA